MNRDSLIALARAAALAHSLDPALVCAVVEQESAWNPWAIRYEPGFLARYVAPLFTAGKISATEAYARSFSWGLMQVMGQVAREHGFGSSPSDSAVIPRRLAAEGYPAAQCDAGVAGAPHAGSSAAPHQENVVIQSPPQRAKDLLFSAPGNSANAGHSLAELCDPAVGLDVGCRVLAHKLAAAGGIVERALQLWNGGANPDYAAQVLVRLPRYRV
jgi:soluble lytic murein transglycosylase-like protein